MTREQICTDCERSRLTEDGAVYCTLLPKEGCCPASTLRRRQTQPTAKCPDATDHWADAEPVKAPPPVPPGERQWLNDRAAACMACPNHLGAYRCKANGGRAVNAIVLDPKAACPDTPPRFVAVDRRDELPPPMEWHR